MMGLDLYIVVISGRMLKDNLVLFSESGNEVMPTL
jgi:hypothetical protein